jgi:hypothetical protein
MSIRAFWIAAVICGFLPIPVLAAGPAPQTVQKNNPPGNGTGNLFPHNQPVPPYSVAGANGEQAGHGLGRPEPNAGATGINGSGGTGSGWAAPAYNNSSTQR